MRWTTCATVLGCGALGACRGGGTPADTARAVNAAATPATIATGLDVPWGVAFLPDRDTLVAERDSGRILLVSHSGRRKREVMRIPGVTSSAGEGGPPGLKVLWVS